MSAPVLLGKLKSFVHRHLATRLQPLDPDSLPLDFPDTLNIETSYRCNLKCIMCPRHFDADLQGMFPMDLFHQRVGPVLNRFKYIHLTGWGEPLMHKQFVEMLQACKDAGTWTCFTTNGLLLKEPLSRRILETGVDTINVSCDGSEPETYEAVRGKGTFELLMERLAHMVALREEMGAQTRIEWTMVLMKANITELPKAVRMASEIGLDRFTAKHMETAINREDLAGALWNTGIVADLTDEEEATYRKAVADARQVAEETGMDLVVQPRRFLRDGECAVKPSQNIFIDYVGNVSSCCYLNKLDVMPYIAKEDRPQDDGVMGSLSLKDFVEILDDPRFVEFRKTWRRGEVPEACSACLQIPRMTTND
ncbi:MAG: radical SAM/SPASM domain-containing protein [Sumerlaeia bacterium]